ncbi:MAG: hypothetical protein JWO60_38 [Frankiales bacterium]|jgi:hypothetical protein|nr:hypothetical protein [Frankiales bacterium]
MGKTEDMRALKAQRAAAQSTAAAAPRRASTQAPPPVRAEAVTPAAEADPEAGAGGDLCGHTSISGRSCTRERDHQKTGTKNHRYG